MTLEEAKKIIKSECYIADLLNLDRTKMVNTALDTVIEAAEQTQLNKAYDKVLEHISEVKRLMIDEYNKCNRLGNEGVRIKGYIESTIYFEEYIKNLKGSDEE